MKTATRTLINSRLGQALKPTVAKVLGRLGFELVPIHRDERQHLLNVLQRLSISGIFDIGANQGQFGLILRRLGYGGGILSLEPMNAAFRELERQARRDPMWSVCKVAIGSESREATLNVSRNSTSSSLLAINRLHVEAEPTSETTRTELVSCKTLDEVRAEYQLAPPYFLKIDVQGSEIAVLHGGQDTLARTSALRVECSLRELYEDSPNIGQLLSRLHDEGFTPIGIEPAFEDGRTGDILQVDVMACRKELL